MDKNMINIDDLVRQRLSGGEEQERSGAWLQMRDLLDQKMPVTRPAGMQWRRMFGAVAGLLLLATVTVGSYEVVTSLRKDAAGDEGKIAGKDHSASLINGRAAEAGAGNTAGSRNSIAAATGTTDEHIVDGARGISANGHDANTRGTKKTWNVAKAAKGSMETAVAFNNNSIAEDIISQPSTAPNGSDYTASVEPVGPLNANSGMANSSSLNSTTNTNATVPTPQSAGNQNNQQPSIAGNTGAGNVAKTAKARSNDENRHNNNNQGTTQPIASINQPAAENSANKFNATEKLAKNPEADLLVLKKDTFAQMTIIRRFIVNPLTMSGKYISDTVSIGKMAIDKWVTNEVKNMNKATSASARPEKQQPVPAASLSLKSSAAAHGFSEEMVPLANFKVKSRKTDKWDARRFDEVVRDAKFNLAQVKFYPGITGGVNATVMGSNNINGFQLGLSGLFAFGDHWNLMAELKYLQRFNNGSILRDDYQAPDPAKPALTSRVEHFFKFPTLQSVEMPIALRYAVNRINLMGGVNMAYNFGLNPEEVTFKYPSEPAAGSPWQNASQLPTVSMDDFNARFSLGYLLGIAYQLSPALHLDMRMTQNVWDNASGTGAQKVSSQLYRSPSFQLSLGYRFSQSQRVPKAVNY